MSVEFLEAGVEAGFERGEVAGILGRDQMLRKFEVGRGAPLGEGFAAEPTQTLLPAESLEDAGDA